MDDLVIYQGDSLYIETDVVDEVGEPIDLSGSEVHYIVVDRRGGDPVLDIREDSDGIELQDPDNDEVRYRVVIRFDIDFPVDRYRHECKVKSDETYGTATIINNTLFVMPSHIGADV